MGNAGGKHLRHKLDVPPQLQVSQQAAFLRSSEGRSRASRSSSDSSGSASPDYLDAESDLSPEECELLKPDDAFMKAVLSFCSHMGARMDHLDNARLYDEFCNYAASHRPNVSVM